MGKPRRAGKKSAQKPLFQYLISATVVMLEIFPPKSSWVGFIAKVILVLAWLWYIWLHPWAKARIAGHPMWAVPIIFLILLSIGIGFWYTRPKEPTPEFDAILQVDMELFGEPIPIQIAPKSEIYIVEIRGNGEVEQYHKTNLSHEHTMLWPTEERPPLGSIPRLNISNAGTKDVFECHFDVRLFVATDSAGGRGQESVCRLSGFDIPTGGDAQFVYFLNRTPNLVGVFLPNIATARVRGELTHREVPALSKAMLKVTLGSESMRQQPWRGVDMIPPLSFEGRIQ